MLKKLVLYLGKRKNPKFTLHASVSNAVLLDFLFSGFMALTRANIRMILHGKNPSLVFFGNNVKVQGMSFAHFGKGVQIGDYVNLKAYGTEGLSLGNYAWIGAHSCLKVSFSFNDPGSYIRIGRNVGIGEYAHLGGAGGLEIGDDCIIGPYFSCHPENHQFYNHQELIRLQGVTRKGIVVGKNCWVGAKVTLLDGVRIGDNCVIAAGAVVTKDMPANAVIGGVPAKVIRYREQENNKTVGTAFNAA